MEYEKISAPLSAFNNLIVLLGNQLSEIYDIDMYKNNHVIFDNESILLFNFVKITWKDKIVNIVFKQSLNKFNIEIYKKTLNNFEDITNIFYKYMYMLKNISKDYDTTISEAYVNSIITDINNKVISDKFYLIPIRNKIEFDINGDNTLQNMFSKYTYVLKLKLNSVGNYNYNIVRIISSDLDESKCIANIKPLEQEIVANGNILRNNVKSFLHNLMIYGKL